MEQATKTIDHTPLAAKAKEMRKAVHDFSPYRTWLFRRKRIRLQHAQKVIMSETSIALLVYVRLNECA